MRVETRIVELRPDSHRVEARSPAGHRLGRYYWAGTRERAEELADRLRVFNENPGSVAPPKNLL